MMNLRRLIFVTVLGTALSVAASAAQAKALTLCWAAWDPANALVELSKDFTKESGVEMKFEFVPWTSYADRFLNELNSHSKLCDLIIGDSQWIGGSAENGHYVKLNEFFNSAGAVKGLDLYKQLFKCCTAPGMTNAYMSEGLDAFKSGQVAMQMNWFAFFPGLFKAMGPDKIGFFVNPSGPSGHYTQLGGQGLSVVSYYDNREAALQYVKWFEQPAVQKKWG